MSRRAPITVVETPEFLAATRHIMDEEEHGLLVDYIAHNPLAGALIPGTGGVLELRWALKGVASGAGHEWSIITTATPCRSSR